MKRRRHNPAYGSVEQFVAARGAREFSMADITAQVGGVPNMLALELARLIAKGQVVKSSKEGGVQFYQATFAPAPKREWQPAHSASEIIPWSERQTERAHAALQRIGEAAKAPEAQAQRAKMAVDRAKAELAAATNERIGIEAKIGAAQLRRDRVALGQLESQLDAVQAKVARARRMLNDAERDAARLGIRKNPATPKRKSTKRRKKK